MKMGRIHAGLVAGLAAGFALSASMSASADDVADFYDGRTVTIVVAAGPGGNHTKYSQTLAPYLQKHMPGNPQFVTQNMGGAGGTKAANYLATAAPQDGSYIGIMLADTPLASRLRATGVKYDPTEFQYLAGADRTRSAFVVFKDTGVKTLEDAKAKEVVFGSTGRGSQTFTVPTITNSVLGTKFKVITGYRGMGGIYIAMEKGEVSGFQSVYASLESLRPQWISENRINVLAALSFDKIPSLPNVPVIFDMLKNEEDKELYTLLAAGGVLGRCWLAPADVPKDRVAALRTAFEKALADPGLLADAEKRRMAIEAVGWQELQDTVQKIASADDSSIQRMRTALGIK